MAWASLPGTPFAYIGNGHLLGAGNTPNLSSVTMDATNEALIFVGYVATSDGGSHTIDTTGSSSLGWRTGAVTFANGGTTAVVGLADVLTTAGPPARAVHASDVITFDVAASFTGGGGGITANAWQTSVPTTGTKTIAHGDFVAFAVQVTARGGADSIEANYTSTGSPHAPTVTTYTGGTYAGAIAGSPNAVITFSDGALGYFYGGTDVISSTTLRTWNSGSATKEYGQLFDLPFPCKVYGLLGIVDPDANFDMVLYSDPLGTPVAERTISTDANTVAGTLGRRIHVLFPTPYFVDAREKVGAVFKPGASNISAYYKTLASATHRVTDPWGTSGYGISRATGAFADANSGLDHYYIGLLVGAFDSGVYPGFALGI